MASLESIALEDSLYDTQVLCIALLIKLAESSRAIVILARLGAGFGVNMHLGRTTSLCSVGLLNR